MGEEICSYWLHATRLQGQLCPMCKGNILNSIPDKYFKRKVNECEWVGELGSHLTQNSVEVECLFVTVACPYS